MVLALSIKAFQILLFIDSWECLDCLVVALFSMGTIHSLIYYTQQSVFLDFDLRQAKKLPNSMFPHLQIKLSD